MRHILGRENVFNITGNTDFQHVLGTTSVTFLGGLKCFLSNRLAVIHCVVVAYLAFLSRGLKQNLINRPLESSVLHGLTPRTTLQISTKITFKRLDQNKVTDALK